MEIFKVGGAVRDKLLGIQATDIDYVVVGATIKDMLNLGYKQVGKDFPVFLHPITHEEYALARLEKKIAKGYTGFNFITNLNVTLQDDLKRRDITINAMAEDAQGNLIDPYNGQADLHNQIIRHVSEAFIEDPLRIFRVARFSARFDFQIAAETLYLMQQIAQNGEIKNISQERIWQEVNKGIKTDHPFVFLKVLYQVGALKYLNEKLPLIFSDKQINKKLEQSLALAVKYKTTNVARFSIIFFYLNLMLDSITINSIVNITNLDNKTKKLCLLTILIYNKIANVVLSAADIYELNNKLYRLKDTPQLDLLLVNLNIIGTIMNATNLDNNLKLLKNILFRLSKIDYTVNSFKVNDAFKIDNLAEKIKLKKMQVILDILNE